MTQAPYLLRLGGGQEGDGENDHEPD